MRLGLDMNSEEDTIDKQCKLLQWKASRHEIKDWNTHLFSNFLYTSFGRPFEENKKLKDLQDERDKNYPRHYVSKIGVTISMWKGLIQNPNVFTEADVSLMKRFYMADNHAATCNDLGIQDGVSSSSYIMPVVSLAKRVAEAANIQPIYGTDGKRTWWRILFWGAYKEDGHFEWKLRPKLAKALASIYPELDNIRNVEIEEQEDYNLVEELKQASLSSAEAGFRYSGKPKKKQPPTYTNGHRTYPRDRQTAINALTHAHYECEIDIEHPSFIRKKSDKKYTEPHHLVPMSYSDKFDVCLDVEENIVSLCSNCHNQIHYGRDEKELLEQLYEERKLALKSVGIIVTLEQLLSMYSVVF
jgi:predicted HNH restriction endonuclease